MNKKNILDTSIEFIKGVGPSRAKLFKEELEITNYDDLINFFPFRYVDRSKFYKIKDLPDLQTDVQIIGRVIKKTSVNTKFNKRLTLTFQDDTGQIELIWFRGYNWIEDSIDKNKDYVVFGKLNWYKNKISITHPEIKLKSTFDRNVPRRLHGIYSSTEKLTASGITQRYFIKIIYELLQSTNGKIRENLPEYIRKKYSLIDRQSAFINIHLPESNDKLKKAINRLKFEELFLNQLGFLLSKTDRLEKIDGFKFDVVGDNFNKFYHNSLPFELTGDQKKVIKEIRKDFNSGNSSLDSNAMRVVEALKYPNVIFRSSLIEQNDDRVYLEGVLEFHGIKQNLKVEGKIESLEDQIKINMDFIIKLSDFEIKRPSLLFRKVEDEILVEINLNFDPA